MEIKLKKIHISERLSEETTAFAADIYVDGKHVGYAKNDGRGGCTEYHALDRETRVILERAEEHCKTLPPKHYPAEHGMQAFDIDMNLEVFIDDLIQQEIVKKDQKKLEKKMVKSVMWGIPNGHSYMEVSFKIPLAQIPRAYLQEKINSYKARFKEGEVFLNTNLEALGIQL